MTYRLANASVEIRAADVVLRYVTSGQQPMRDTLLLTTFITSADGSTIRQLGFKLLDNELIATFAFNHNEAWQKNLQATPRRTGDEWTIVLPSDALDGITSGKWHAVLNVAGNDVNSIDGAL